MRYYDVNPIIDLGQKKECPTIVIVGGKGNGKTYGILKRYLKEFLENGRILRYLRRYKESIAPKAIKSLLNPQREYLKEITNNKYNDFQYYHNRFYLVKIDENGNKVDKNPNPFMVCSALNSVEGFTGADEGDCSAIFFDEFLSREKELADEFTSLMIFHDNCIRNRTEHYTPMILVGNTVSKNSTLAKDFGIDLYHIEQGVITAVYNSKKVITALVEHCPIVEVMQDAGNSYYKRYENDKIKMIYTGDWSIGNYPRLKSRYVENSKTIATIMLISPDTPLTLTIRCYKSFMFGFISAHKDDDKPLLTITTETTPLKKDLLNYYNSDIPIMYTIGLLLLRKQFYFESGVVGEMFRDFLLNLNGADQFRKIYK